MSTLLEPQGQVNSSQEYFEGIYLDKYGNYRVDQKGGKYLGTVPTIEEALQYRDLFRKTRRKNIVKPSELDLKKNNPYLAYGLKYPLPPRLQSMEGKSKKGHGSITRDSKIYKITCRGKYYCSCRTYEQAYYVRQELIKADWNKDKLPEILDSYPEWYTWLMRFYLYVNRNDNQYYITIPKKYTDTGNIQYLRYNNLEDALYERDFLIEHNWDYNLLVECIDDTVNPYYDMELPPYPERKIRNIRPRKNHDQDLRRMQNLILSGQAASQAQLAREMGVKPGTIRLWLKQYNTHFSEFQTLVLLGEDPLEKFSQERLIYKPDLSPEPCTTFKGYIHKDPSRPKRPYRVRYNRKSYGSYPTHDIAKKIVKDLMQCGWDKEQLPCIQEKHGCPSPYNKQKGIYYNRHKTHWVIQKKIDGKTQHFGTYKTRQLAEITRSLLILHDWNKDMLPELQKEAEYIQLNLINNSTMFPHKIEGGTGFGR